MTIEKILKESLTDLTIDNITDSHIEFTVVSHGDIAPYLTVNSLLRLLNLIPYHIYEKNGKSTWRVMILNQSNIDRFGEGGFTV